MPQLFPRTNGGIDIFVSNATHVVVDIDGYFIPSSPSALAFYPLTPCRVADTRGANGSLSGPFLGAGQGRSFPVLSSGCNVPSAAQAYSLNFTVVPHAPLGFLAAWPTGQEQPLASILNAPTASVTANAAIVPAGTNGAVTAYASSDSDLVIDINGYFAPTDAGGLSLYTVAPCRVLDTEKSGRIVALQGDAPGGRGDERVRSEIDGSGICAECHGCATGSAWLFVAMARRPSPAAGLNPERRSGNRHFKHGDCAHIERLGGCFRLAVDAFDIGCFELFRVVTIEAWCGQVRGEQGTRMSFQLPRPITVTEKLN